MWLEIYLSIIIGVLTITYTFDKIYWIVADVNEEDEEPEEIPDFVKHMFS